MVYKQELFYFKKIYVTRQGKNPEISALMECMDFNSIYFSVKGFQAEDVLGDVYKTIILAHNRCHIWGATSLISCGPAVSFHQEKSRLFQPHLRSWG